MKYFIDCEFIEYPCTIDLISIGIVAEDNREFYGINADCNYDKAGEWVRENVLDKLPPRNKNIDWMTLRTISAMILELLSKDSNIEFWGYYCDYDWVVFCWLFGTMEDLPDGYPMYCRDLKQWCDVLGNPKLPEPDSNLEHNALEDARWNRSVYYYLEEIERKQNENE